MKFDDILVEIGEYGWYQKILVFLLSMSAALIGLEALGSIFTNAIPNYRCYVNGCDSDATTYNEDFLNFTTPFDHSISKFSRCQLFAVENGSCNNGNVDWASTYNCDKWKYDNSDYVSTVVTQFNLVCDKENLAALAQAIFMAGGMFGGVIAGVAADKYGRKIVMFVCTVICMAAGISSAFVPNYLYYLFTRFLIGGGVLGIYLSAFVTIVEFVGKSYRGPCAMAVNIVFALGEMILGGMAYAIRDWRYLQIAISAQFALFLMYLWIIPESPRWMLLKGKVNEAEKTLAKIAKSNGKILTKDLLFGFQPEDEGSNEAKTETEQETWMDLFRISYLRLITINMSINWFMVVMAFYGISLSTPSIGGNQYMNFIIVSAVEIPAYLFSMISINKFGRRYSLSFLMIVGGIIGISNAFVPDNPDYQWLRIALATGGKFGASASFAIIYIFTAELYPTGVRNVGMAINSFIGHLGSVIAPYISLLVTVNAYLPLVIFGLCSLISGVLSLTLPETLGKRLPETVKDCEDLAVCSCFPKRGKSRRGLLF